MHGLVLSTIKDTKTSDTLYFLVDYRLKVVTKLMLHTILERICLL